MSNYIVNCNELETIGLTGEDNRSLKSNNNTEDVRD